MEKVSTQYIQITDLLHPMSVLWFNKRGCQVNQMGSSSSSSFLSPFSLHLSLLFFFSPLIMSTTGIFTVTSRLTQALKLLNNVAAKRLVALITRIISNLNNSKVFFFSCLSFFSLFPSLTFLPSLPVCSLLSTTNHLQPCSKHSQRPCSLKKKRTRSRRCLVSLNQSLSW